MRGLRLAKYVSLTALGSLKMAWPLHLASALTMTIAFVILGSGFFVFDNLRQALLGARTQSKVWVYLAQDQNVSRTRADLKEAFCKRSFVKTCHFQSAKVAKAEFVKKNPDFEQAVEALGENPFPASMAIEISAQQRAPKVLTDFAQELRALDGVESVDEGSEWFGRWAALMALADWAIWILGFLLGLACVFLISNTIGLVVYSRRDEVEIMSLVGATSHLIRGPFLLEGALHGLLGVLMALMLLHLGFSYLLSYFEAHWQGHILSSLVFLPVSAQLIFVLLGMLVGVMGSFLAVGRFLNT